MTATSVLYHYHICDVHIRQFKGEKSKSLILDMREEMQAYYIRHTFIQNTFYIYIYKFYKNECLDCVYVLHRVKFVPYFSSMIFSGPE